MIALPGGVEELGVFAVEEVEKADRGIGRVRRAGKVFEEQDGEVGDPERGEAREGDLEIVPAGEGAERGDDREAALAESCEAIYTLREARRGFLPGADEVVAVGADAVADDDRGAAVGGTGGVSVRGEEVPVAVGAEACLDDDAAGRRA